MTYKVKIIKKLFRPDIFWITNEIIYKIEICNKPIDYVFVIENDIDSLSNDIIEKILRLNRTSIKQVMMGINPLIYYVKSKEIICSGFSNKFNKCYNRIAISKEVSTLCLTESPKYIQNIEEIILPNNIDFQILNGDYSHILMTNIDNVRHVVNYSTRCIKTKENITFNNIKDTYFNIGDFNYATHIKFGDNCKVTTLSNVPVDKDIKIILNKNIKEIDHYFYKSSNSNKYCTIETPRNDIKIIDKEILYNDKTNCFEYDKSLFDFNIVKI